jgi:glycosyltransferase involved in cell wall biosynthesis
MQKENHVKLAYISPSVLPSRSANSIHVVHQCDALGKLGVETTLFAKRSFSQENNLRAEVKKVYGVELESVNLRTVYTPWARANNIVIALSALRLLSRERFDGILSRNLFASLFLALVSRIPLIIELHQLENGFRGWIQRIACRCAGVKVVVISQQLCSDLRSSAGHLNAPVWVFHDAAPETLRPLSDQERQNCREELLPEPCDREKFVCGYVGHLYPGRGIEVIEALAHECPEILFLVVGGNDNDVAERRSHNTLPNLKFLGHVLHPDARRAMSSVDVLLMPYQDKVSIGLDGHDTGRWMSPMKMFEYMSSGTAFIASDLPVLREVLRDGYNAVLVPPKSVEDWRRSILALRDDPVLRNELARQAYEDYQSNYTWLRRAERIVALFEK